jgi:putative membrane protein
MPPGSSGRRQPVGTEPDPRFTLANERTYLAWVRTTLAVVAGAVALESLQIPSRDGLRGLVVGGLLLLAAVVVSLAHLRWRRIQDALRRGEPLPTSPLGSVMTVGVLLSVALLAVVLLL